MSSHFHSLIFTEPYGTRVSQPYAQLAAWELASLGPLSLQALPPGDHLLYTPGAFATRGALWFDGEHWGSHFPHSVPVSQFFARSRAHFRHVLPFVLTGFTRQTSLGAHFLACDLPVWNDRLLTNVAFSDRHHLIRFTLSRLVGNQPLKFLQERRLDFPIFHTLPRQARHRHQALSGNSDYYVIDSVDSAWRRWCLDWVE